MIFSTGEILADMIAGKNGETAVYARYAGGAPFNVACAVKKCGGNSCFYGRVGADGIGSFLREFAQSKGLDETLIERDGAHNTTLAFVDLDENGERSFSFYRKNTADYRLRIESAVSFIQNSTIVHLGSLIVSEAEGRAYADALAEQTHKEGKLFSFDVNYRDDVFASEAEAVAVYKTYMEKADIVKLSESEIALFSDASTLFEKLQTIAKKNQLVVVTLGGEGSAYFYNGEYGVVPSIKIKPVDTTGAGDAFFGALLAKIDENGFVNLSQSLRFANIVGALTATGKGAIDAIPTLEIVGEYF